MDTLLVSTNRCRQPMPVMPMGACLVAEAAERHGHRVRLLDFMFRRNPLRDLEGELAAHPPDVVGLSVRNIDNNDLQEPQFFLEELGPVLRAVRRHTNAPAVVGGASAWVMPDEILRRTGATALVRADGERVFPALLDRLDSGAAWRDLPGISVAENGGARHRPLPLVSYPEECPAPNYRRWLAVNRYLAEFATAPLLTKIGCEFHCVYCTYRKLERGPYHLFHPDSVADAVQRLAGAGVRDVEFVDNVFNVPREHALAVCDSLTRAGHRARLHCLELNPLEVDDELLARMARAGFRGIGITAENVTDRVLSGLGKGFRSADVHRAAEAVRRQPLPCLWIFLLGGPGETAESARQTLAFAARIRRPGDAVFFNVGVRVYPGTALERNMRQAGLPLPPAEEMLEPVFYLSPELPREELFRITEEAMARNLHFIDSRAIGLPLLTRINRLAYRLGVRPPLWRYTGAVRRSLRWLGLEP